MLRRVRFLNESQHLERTSQHNVLGKLVGRASRIRERVCSCLCEGLLPIREMLTAKTLRRKEKKYYVQRDDLFKPVFQNELMKFHQYSQGLFSELKPVSPVSLLF